MSRRSGHQRLTLVAGLCVAIGLAFTEAAIAAEIGAPPEKSVTQLPNVDDIVGAQQNGSNPLDDSSTPSTEQNGDNSAELNQPQIGEETAMSIPPKVAAPPAAAQPSVNPSMPPLAQVKLHYKNGKYRDALNVISKMKATEVTHYYAGLCYQGQGQLQQAAAEFNFVASYAKDPAIKYNAARALNAVSSYAKSRTYGGQGNTFARVSARGGGGSRGGGGAVRRG